MWDACVRTTDLCTDDAFMDTPLREKRNWLGDGSHAVLGALAAWGDTPVIRRYFQLAVQGALGDGMLRMFFPGGDFPEKTKVVNTIPQHALVWACRVGEFYRHTGDREFLAAMLPTLEGLADWCDRHANVDGLVDRLPYGCWLDWTPTDIRGANLGTNAFRLRLLDDLAFQRWDGPPTPGDGPRPRRASARRSAGGSGTRGTAGSATASSRAGRRAWRASSATHCACSSAWATRRSAAARSSCWPRARRVSPRARRCSSIM